MCQHRKSPAITGGVFFRLFFVGSAFQVFRLRFVACLPPYPAQSRRRNGYAFLTELRRIGYGWRRIAAPRIAPSRRNGFAIRPVLPRAGAIYPSSWARRCRISRRVVPAESGTRQIHDVYARSLRLGRRNGYARRRRVSGTTSMCAQKWVRSPTTPVRYTSATALREPNRTQKWVRPESLHTARYTLRVSTGFFYRLMLESLGFCRLTQCASDSRRFGYAPGN